MLIEYSGTTGSVIRKQILVDVFGIEEALQEPVNNVREAMAELLESSDVARLL